MTIQFSKNTFKNSNLGKGSADFSFDIRQSDTEIRDDIFPGQNIGLAVNIQEMKIITNDNIEVDLLEVYDGIGIKEGLYTTFIQGTIRIVDPVGGLEKFALRGGERLYLKVCKPNGDVIIWRRDLIISKIGVADFDIMSYKTSYDLQFISSAFVYALRKNMYKSFSSQSIADIVLNVYDEISTNALFIEDPKVTLANTSYQCSGKMPHEVILDMSKRACSKNRFFVFFERFVPVFGRATDTQGELTAFSASHYFGSIEKLIEDSEKFANYNIFFKREVRGDVEPSYIRAFSFRRLDSFRHIESLRKGFYGTEFCSINILNRKCKNQNVGYLDAKNVNLYPNKLIGPNNIFASLNKSLGEVPGKKVFVSSMNDPVNRESWLKHEHVKRIETVHFKVAIEIAGATNNIGIGNIVNLAIPSGTAKAQQPTSSIIRYDPIHSGKYIVTGVDHIIRNGQYLKNLELSRDSLPFSFENATSDNFIINNIEAFITGRVS